jgi:hypothetical protein
VSGRSIKEQLEQHGVIGDVVFDLCRLAESEAELRPGSMFDYARWHALDELSRYFDDDQGVPTHLVKLIDSQTRSALIALVDESRGFRSEAEAGDALGDLLQALAHLRT